MTVEKTSRFYREKKSRKICDRIEIIVKINSDFYVLFVYVEGDFVPNRKWSISCGFVLLWLVDTRRKCIGSIKDLQPWKKRLNIRSNRGGFIYFTQKTIFVPIVSNWILKRNFTLNQRKSFSKNGPISPVHPNRKLHIFKAAYSIKLSIKFVCGNFENKRDRPPFFKSIQNTQLLFWIVEGVLLPDIYHISW